MPVTINEFEVVVDPPPSSTETSSPEAPPAERGATPSEIENLRRREKERLTRVWAH